MALKLVTAPSAVITVDEAKSHLRVFHNDDDQYITSLVAAATGWADGKDGWLGRSIGQQTWDLALDAFPDGGIIIPLSPLISVTSVKYNEAAAGVETTLVEGTDYLVDNYGDPGWVVPVDGVWPETKSVINAVKIRFVSGYATVPPSIKHALLLLVGHWYENREAASEVKLTEIPMAVDSLLIPYRNWLAA